MVVAKIRVLAWVALGVSAFAVATAVWINSSENSGLYKVVFGFDSPGAMGVMAAVYVVAFTLDVVAAAVLKGWRNRVIALAGVIVLLIPITVLTWRTAFG